MSKSVKETLKELEINLTKDLEQQNLKTTEVNLQFVKEMETRCLLVVQLHQVQFQLEELEKVKKNAS